MQRIQDHVDAGFEMWEYDEDGLRPQKDGEGTWFMTDKDDLPHELIPPPDFSSYELRNDGRYLGPDGLIYEKHDRHGMTRTWTQEERDAFAVKKLTLWDSLVWLFEDVRRDIKSFIRFWRED